MQFQSVVFYQQKVRQARESSSTTNLDSIIILSNSRHPQRAKMDNPIRVPIWRIDQALSLASRPTGLDS